MAVSLAVKIWPGITNSVGKAKIVNGYKPASSSNAVLPSQETSSHRRLVLVCSGVSLVAILTFKPAWAGEESNGPEDKDESVIGAIKSIFNPDEKTKSGKVLPKAYLKSAREVVKTLRESLEEDPKDNAKFRRTADSAKESIREYLGNWRGKQTVVNEESYVKLEKAIRALASFYSKAGPSAALPEAVKFDILNDLKTAEEFL